MAHVRLVGLDVQLLSRVLLDGRADVGEEFDFALQPLRLGFRVACLGEILGKGCVGAREGCRRLVALDAQRLGLVQCIGVGGIPAEVVQVLLHLARGRHRLAQVMQRLARLVELLFALDEPVLQAHVVVPAARLVRVQLVRAVDGERFLHVAEQLLEVDDVPVVLVVAVQAVGAADGLEQVVVVQLVVEIDVVVLGAVLREIEFGLLEDADEVGQAIHHRLAFAELVRIVEVGEVAARQARVGVDQRLDDLRVDPVADVRLALEGDDVAE